VVNEGTGGRRTCPALHALQAALVPVNPKQNIITTGNNKLTVEQGERIAVSIQHVIEKGQLRQKAGVRQHNGPLGIPLAWRTNPCVDTREHMDGWPPTPCGVGVLHPVATLEADKPLLLSVISIITVVPSSENLNNT
jgi:hypothetical protein